MSVVPVDVRGNSVCFICRMSQKILQLRHVIYTLIHMATGLKCETLSTIQGS